MVKNIKSIDYINGKDLEINSLKGYVLVRYNELPLGCGLIKDNKSLAGFMSLLIIVVYILVFSKIVNLLLELKENQYITYLNLLTPGLDILNAILPYIQYILLGALIAWGLQSAKK